MPEFWNAKGVRVPFSTFWRMPPRGPSHDGSIGQWWTKPWYEWWLRAARGMEDVTQIPGDWWRYPWAPVTQKEVAAIQIQRWFRVWRMHQRDTKAQVVLDLGVLKEAVAELASGEGERQNPNLASEDGAGSYLLTWQARWAASGGLFDQAGRRSLNPMLGTLVWQHKQLAACLRQIYFSSPLPGPHAPPYVRWGAPKWLGRYGGGDPGRLRRLEPLWGY